MFMLMFFGAVVSTVYVVYLTIRCAIKKDGFKKRNISTIVMFVFIFGFVITASLEGTKELENKKIELKKQEEIRISKLSSEEKEKLIFIKNTKKKLKESGFLVDELKGEVYGVLSYFNADGYRVITVYTTEKSKSKLLEYARGKANTTGKTTTVHFFDSPEKTISLNLKNTPQNLLKAMLLTGYNVSGLTYSYTTAWDTDEFGKLIKKENIIKIK